MFLTSSLKLNGKILGCITILICFFSCKGKALDTESKYMEAMKLYGNMDFVNAEIKCNEVIDSNNSFLKGYFLKSKILFHTGRKKESIDLMKKIVKKHPAFIDAKLFLARALIETDSLKDAEKLLATLAEENGCDFRVYELYSILGKKNKDLKSRLYFQKKAEQCLGESYLVFLDLASIYRAFGMEEDAGKYLEKARVLSESEALLEGDDMKLKKEKW